MPVQGRTAYRRQFALSIAMAFVAASGIAACGGAGTSPAITASSNSSVPGSAVTTSASVSTSPLTTARQLTAALATYDQHSFVASVGISARFTDAGYASQSPLLRGLGAQHFRAAVGVLYGDVQAMLNAKDICQHGMTIDLLTDRFHSIAEISSVITSLPGHCVVSLEGPNENDNSGQGVQYDPSFATDLPVFMASLRQAFPQFTIIAPALISTAAYAAVGNISATSNFGNMHDYSPGFSPGILYGWGGMVPPNPVCCYGSVAWNIANAQLAVPGKPVSATETGYCTAVLHGCLPADVQAKYIPRLLLLHWMMGVPFTYIFALQALDSTTSDGSLALVGTSGVPFSAYYTMQYLQRTMVGDAPATDPIVIQGGDSTVRHVTMQDSSGTLHVAAWIEAASYDPNANGGAGAEIAVPPQAVQINSGTTASSGTLTTCAVEGSGRCSTRPFALTNGSAAITLTDTVQVLTM